MDPLNQASENSLQSAPASDEVPNDGTGMSSLSHCIHHGIVANNF
jgi:hypothetical protein